MRWATAALISTVVVTALSCGPQCEQAAPAQTSVCRLPTDPAIEAGAPFIIRALPALSGGTCQVTVNGSQLSVTVSGSVCGGAGARPVPPRPAVCQVPALDAGTYTVAGTTFSIPMDGGSEFPDCP